MRLRSFLRPAAVVADLTSSDKSGVLRELAHALAAVDPLIDEQRVFQALEEREMLGSTGLGHGVAIPHAKVNELAKIHAAFGRSARGVEFQSLDSEPVHLFFMLIAPHREVGHHLMALERISKLLHDQDTRQDLLTAEGSALYEAVCRMDEKG